VELIMFVFTLVSVAEWVVATPSGEETPFLEPSV
jgi:hypothetical protein